MRSFFERSYRFVLTTVLALTFTLTLICVAAMANVDDVVAPDQFLSELFKSLGGLQGAGALAVAAIVTQIAMNFFKTPMATMAGKWRLLIVALLSLGSGVLALMVSGLPISAALMHASTLTSAQVMIHQFYKQFVEKAGEPNAAPKIA